MTPAELKQRLRIPVIAAPMLLVSGPDLVIAAAKAGILCAFPTANARTAEDFEAWLIRIESELLAAAPVGGSPPPYAVNLIVHGAGSPRFLEDLALIERFKPPVVITSVGQPGEVAKRVHDYGGLVFHDVASLRHAEKAIGAGVDGLILLTAGAGGHTGVANPFAFVPQLRRTWDGAIILAGAISDGRSVYAAEVLGADFAYMGTRFAATEQSMAPAEYRNLLVSQQMADVITTNRISGLPATFLRGSITRVGLDPDNLPAPKAQFQADLPEHIRAWRDVWSGGHGVGAIDSIPSVQDLVDQLVAEYQVARSGEQRRAAVPA
jgi:nitronate monooxygenase